MAKQPTDRGLAPLRDQYDNMLACIRCGQCLPACPTYRISFAEEEGPRGRIAIARALVEGHLELTQDLIVHEDNCLVCEGCTAVCPAGVKMEPIQVALRSAIASTPGRQTARQQLASLLLASLFGDMRRFRVACGLARYYQRSPASWLARNSGLLKLLRVQDKERLLPAMDKRFFVARGQEFEPEGQARGTAAMFAGCIMSTAFAETDRATVRVLARNGFRVVVPERQGCCGALHLHGGQTVEAAALARANIDAFEDHGQSSPVVVNAAGCGSTLKGYGHLLAADPDYAERAASFAARVKDVTEFLAGLPLVPTQHPVERLVTLQEPCHLANAQRIREAPRAILRAIPGLKIVEMNESALCCGSAGIYNLTHPGQAEQLLQRKITNIEATGAETVVTANPGCHLQVQAGLRARGSSTGVCHIVDLLDRAYGCDREDKPAQELY